MAEKQKNVVELLEQQHQQIRRLLDDVVNSKGDERKDHFQRLVRLLAVHETAEEEVVHPYVRDHIEGGEQVVKDRTTEEKGAKETLQRLEDMDTESSEFHRLFDELRQNVLAHAEAEEKYEFTHLRAVADQDALRGLAKAVEAAEAVAPTHPHPGTESAVKNVVVGPLASVVDRTRDAIRAATGKSGH
ncbi:hemerythrin [Streptomyces sp. Ru73]|uniref:hemerythrin domain-containing protein n=1 Tax=Streptomyces sp. Ru73 TaxID=2080748 RepID=UPI000CDD1613|nr:hemerythrin domain-containing protein [Streptomyces sp. Ru73]POX39328.1 hemerythrin [Streptomyces sp. Ru73]